MTPDRHDPLLTFPAVELVKQKLVRAGGLREVPATFVARGTFWGISQMPHASTQNTSGHNSMCSVNLVTRFGGGKCGLNCRGPLLKAIEKLEIAETTRGEVPEGHSKDWFSIRWKLKTQSTCFAGHSRSAVCLVSWTPLGYAGLDGIFISKVRLNLQLFWSGQLKKQKP